MSIEAMRQARDAFSDIESVMGPAPAPCCVGCAYEWNEALRITRAAIAALDAALAAPAERACVECGGPLQWRCPACRIAQSAAAAAPAEPVRPTPAPGQCPQCGEYSMAARAAQGLFGVMESKDAAPPAVPQTDEKDAARDVLAERKRQIEQEGWTPKGDDRYDDAELALAAACYAHPHPPIHPDVDPDLPRDWPWAPKWWKPRDRRSNLVRAGALILAEIERLDRAAMSTEQPK